MAAEAELAAGPRATLRAQRRVPRRVLEIKDGFKERRAARHAGPALDIYQWRVLVRAKGDPGGSQVLQPRQQARLRDDANPDRHGVDKKPDDRFGSFNGGPAAGANGAEDHVLFAAVAAEQQRPGALEDGVEREPVPLRDGFERDGHGLRQTELLFPAHFWSGLVAD